MRLLITLIDDEILYLNKNGDNLDWFHVHVRDIKNDKGFEINENGIHTFYPYHIVKSIRALDLNQYIYDGH